MHVPRSRAAKSDPLSGGRSCMVTWVQKIDFFEIQPRLEVVREITYSNSTRTLVVADYRCHLYVQSLRWRSRALRQLSKRHFSSHQLCPILALAGDEGHRRKRRVILCHARRSSSPRIHSTGCNSAGRHLEEPQTLGCTLMILYLGLLSTRL